MSQSQLFVDIPTKPILRNKHINRTQRYHVLPLKVTPTTHTLLICLLVAQFRQILDQRNENILWIVFLKFRFERNRCVIFKLL